MKKVVLLTPVIEFIKEVWSEGFDDFEMCDGYDAMVLERERKHGDVGTVAYWTKKTVRKWVHWRLRAVFGIVCFMVLLLVCKVRGHNYVSDDTAGPESGYMGATCRRCGHSWGQWLY